VANAGSAGLWVINTASRTVSARLPVGLLPAEVAFSPWYI
jgi:YVTN family beta-propeller protein